MISSFNIILDLSFVAVLYSRLHRVLPEACTKLQSIIIWDVLSNKFHIIVCLVNKTYIAPSLVMQVHSCYWKCYSTFLLSCRATWKRNYVTNNTKQEKVWIKYDRLRTFGQPLLQWKSNKYYILCVFVVLVVRHVMRLRHIVTCNLYGCIIFFHIAHKRDDIQKKSVEHKMFVLTFCTYLSETLLIIGRNERGIAINVHRSSCKAPTILVRS